MPDRASIPRRSLILGWAPIALLALLALVAWIAPLRPALFAIGIAQAWGAAILLFLAGVRRGLSFFTDGGPRPIQLATMAWLFVLGLGGLLAPAAWAFAALIVGYGSVALLDPPAARRGEVPGFFARLRPWQMLVAVLALTAVMIRVTLL